MSALAVRPCCVVFMPGGSHTAADGVVVDFDAVYAALVQPAIIAAGLEPIRIASSPLQSVVDRPTFERLILCTHAVVDVTRGNAAAGYALGVRHAARPSLTVPIVAAGAGPRLGTGPIDALEYAIGDTSTNAVAADVARLAARLSMRPEAGADSPVRQLIEGDRERRVDHEKTDRLRERMRYSPETRRALRDARAQGRDAVAAVESRLGRLDGCETGALLDLLLSYRAVSAWDDVIALVDRLPAPVAAMPLVREQLGMALNRAGRSDEAEHVLQSVLADCGPSSETLALLGRVYKDRWRAAAAGNDGVTADRCLRQAIDAYRRGFEADWRDAYPGINAVTLMALAEPPDPQRKTLLPIVRYAVERRVADGTPDYWDHATLLELAVLADDRSAAESALRRALDALREGWEAETTANTLGLIRDALQARGEPHDWLQRIERRLIDAAR